MTPLIVGSVLALSVGLSFTLLGMDRERVFYPVVTIVIASYYVLFAVMGAGTETLVLELLFVAVFAGFAVTGFRWSLWLVAVALAVHGVFDAIHDQVITNPGVPAWWPAFCGAYDVVAAAYLAWLLGRGRLQAGVVRSALTGAGNYSAGSTTGRTER